MKVGIITNLIDIDGFVKNRLISANADKWMQATGGNTGNVAFVHGVQSLVDEEADVVRWSDDPAKLNQEYDHLIVCCANQIGKHVDLAGWADRLRNFDLPTTFIGLGAQSDAIGEIPEVPDGTKAFLDLSKQLRVDANKPNIITRGEFSSSVLQHYGVDSAPFGCPSQFISLQHGLGQRCFDHQQRTQYDRIMTAAGNPFHKSSSLENTLTEIVEKYKGDYILQHPKSLIQLALGETTDIEPNTIKALERVYSRIGKWSEIKAWFESYGVFFADAQNWMHYSRHFTLAIGPRYHGVALPIQAGVPGKVISIDSRTEELAVTTGIPTVKYKDVEDMSADELIASCRWSLKDALHYDKTRVANAVNYLQFFAQNNLNVKPELKQLAEGSF
ncbi:polysaccharide pyruvyl transferase family protein [Brumicola nitratireducens]|uniref:Uncharacterized protein n=1 Tax=Glaciecola nitratireducens (strain JCM 12485 / KCTC 12276 / FR1064) TaxID=1085623 RepID=G4QIQ6_GLANF|nr:polysaccharide pyruvyl transferase family protein [Glaciecola nitratireducens]AEP31211.1 hypothetical protein GNIT_3116 [Glaciecola nitratireducens FR1064]